MIEVNIPGFGELRLEHVVSDYNGTLAQDGALLPGVGRALCALARDVRLHVVTADTFGLAGAELAGLPVELTVLGVGDQTAAKLACVTALGPRTVVALGNGRNDAAMLRAAGVGIVLVQGEGAAAEAFAAADVVVADAAAALGLLLEPRRLVATLRS
jgi:soluble P-type ATPase